MHKTALIVVILAVAISSQLTLTRASANDGPRIIADQQATSDDRGAVALVLFDPGLASEIEIPVGVMADTCKDIHPSIRGVNGWGETLWRLVLNVSWCYDGSVVTYYYQYHSTSTSYDWADLGTEADSVSSPSTGYSFTDGYHRQHFARCAYIPNWTCWDDVHPWVSSRVTGYGGWATNAGQ